MSREVGNESPEPAQEVEEVVERPQEVFEVRRASVRDIVRQTEEKVQQQERGEAPQPAAPVRRGKKRITSAFFGKPGFRRLSKKKEVPVKKRSVTLQTQKPLSLAEYPEHSLQQHLPYSVDMYNKRLEAKKEYISQQKQLRAEYEQKLRELHHSFRDMEHELINQFPQPSPDLVENMKKLEEDAAKETDEAVVSKLKKEVVSIKEEIERRKPVSELEYDRLKGLWLCVGVNDWDVLTHRNFGYNNFKADVFEKMRYNNDKDINYAVGEKVDGKEVLEGDCANWALSIIRSEEDNVLLMSKRSESMFSNIGRIAVKLANVDNNKENRAKAVKTYKKQLQDKQNNDSALVKAVESLTGAPLDPTKMERLFMEESKLQRNVILRITEVDRKAETVKIAMVLDRNGRPCLGGLPKEEYLEKEAYDGANKIVSPVVPAEEVTSNGSSESSNSYADTGSSEAPEEAQVATPVQQAAEAEDDHIEGYRSVESSNTKMKKYIFSINELITSKGISVVEEDMKLFYKEKFNSYIPHVTYQRIAGFEKFNNNMNQDNNNNNNNNRRIRRRDYHDDPGNFQIVDLGVKLKLDPLIPFDEYEQEWRNGVLYSVRHRQDGPIRFVGYNETGFGFMEERPIEMTVQQVKDSDGKITGVNILYMSLFDVNEQACVDTLYLNDDEDMATNKKWRVFGKDAIGNRLAYRVVAQHGHVQAVLYPFQGRVKEAELKVNDVTDLKEGDWVNVRVEGQTERRLAKVRIVPTGLVIGQVQEEKKCQSETTPFLEMIRLRTRVMTEMPGLVDLEIHCEGDELLQNLRNECWPIECIYPATEEDKAFLKDLEIAKEETAKAQQLEISGLVDDVNNFVNDREKRRDRDAFLQEAEALLQSLEEKKKVASGDKIAAVEGALTLLKRKMQGVKRVNAMKRKSKTTTEEKKKIEEEEKVVIIRDAASPVDEADV